VVQTPIILFSTGPHLSQKFLFLPGRDCRFPAFNIETVTNARELLGMTSWATAGPGSVTAQRVEGVTHVGLIGRQAGFIVTVMLHSGVFVGRQYAALLARANCS
jgi:hypothetical protein